jgi:hypothetical protein
MFDTVFTAEFTENAESQEIIHYPANAVLKNPDVEVDQQARSKIAMYRDSGTDNVLRDLVQSFFVISALSAFSAVNNCKSCIHL